MPALLTMTCSPPKVVHGEVDQGLDLVDVGHVGPPEGHGVTQSGGQGLTLVHGDVGHDHRGALVGEQLDGGPADPARTPRDDGDLPREFHAHVRRFLSDWRPAPGRAPGASAAPTGSSESGAGDRT